MHCVVFPLKRSNAPALLSHAAFGIEILSSALELRADKSQRPKRFNSRARSLPAVLNCQGRNRSGRRRHNVGGLRCHDHPMAAVAEGLVAREFRIEKVLMQARPVVGKEDGIAGIRGIVFHTSRLASRNAR